MPVLLVPLLAALGMAREGGGGEGVRDVVVRVQAGEVGADDEAVVLHVVLDPERVSRRERQQGRQGRLQPVQQLREYGGCLTARQLGHDVLLLLRWSWVLIRRLFARTTPRSEYPHCRDVRPFSALSGSFVAETLACVLRIAPRRPASADDRSGAPRSAAVRWLPYPAAGPECRQDPASPPDPHDAQRARRAAPS